MAHAEIKSNLEAVRERIAKACQRAGRAPDEITLVAVTKTVEPATIEAAFKLGIRHFGENRVQEAGDKIRLLSYLKPGLTWHMVGRLQSNKVGTVLKLFDVIQSVDSVRLAESISRRAPDKIPVLLQVNVAGEATKGGFSPDEIGPALKIISHLPNIEVEGLMTIAPAVANAEEVRPVFRKLRLLRDSLHLEHLSMGMSDDFEVAVEEGATMVRIGRAIFGERPAG